MIGSFADEPRMRDASRPLRDPLARRTEAYVPGHLISRRSQVLTVDTVGESDVVIAMVVGSPAEVASANSAATGDLVRKVIARRVHGRHEFSKNRSIPG